MRRSVESALVDQFPHSLQAVKPNISHGKIVKNMLKADSIIRWNCYQWEASKEESKARKSNHRHNNNGTKDSALKQVSQHITTSISF